MKTFRWPHVVAGFVAVAVIGAVAHRVAANAPPGRYVINGDGTVTDTETLLTWQQAVPATAYAWSDAVTYCSQNMASLPGGPWRLPNAKELQTIVDESQASSPLIDQTAFPNVNGTPSWGFWTSSPVAGSPSSAWYVTFDHGYTVSGDVAGALSVRCVR